MILCRLLIFPLQAFFSSVIPGEEMKGHLGKSEFPRWLGQNSKKSKCDRMLQELRRHTRLSYVMPLLKCSILIILIISKWYNIVLKVLYAGHRVLRQSLDLTIFPSYPPSLYDLYWKK